MKVVTFGEIMLRLSTPAFSRFVQTNSFDVNFGGGEANVAISLANYGLQSYFVTKLPKHEIGQSAINSLKKFGVCADYIVRGGERIGIYFLETGASQRSSKVIYDRSGAAITTLAKDEINWDEIFQDAKWFHWTGITPALGKNAKENLIAACRAAKNAKVVISADLNFRAKLWNTKEAQAVMIPLMEYVDVCIANEEDIEQSLGLKVGNTSIEKANLDFDSYCKLALEVKEKFELQSVAITLRESYSASRNGWSALLLDDKDCKTPYHSKKYDINIVDRVGSGDAFAGGLIYGLLVKDNSMDALEFAVAASCIKHSIPGDFNFVSIDEVEKLMKGTGSGRVER